MDLITPWLDRIAEYGLLGIMFLLVGYVLYKRDQDLTKERSARLADTLALSKVLEADTAAKVAANASRETHNRLVETLVKNQEVLIAKMDFYLKDKS